MILVCRFFLVHPTGAQYDGDMCNSTIRKSIIQLEKQPPYAPGPVCQEKWEEVVCKMSSKCLTSNGSLGLHFRRQHEEEGDFWECTKCSKT